MPPARLPASTDAIERQRLRIQKKSWRALLALTEEERRRNILYLAWCAVPVERLQVELEYLDEHGKGLWDGVVKSDLNPFSKLKRACWSLSHHGKRGDLRPLFDAFPADMHQKVLDDCRSMLSSFAGQAEWRFLEFTMFPRRWAEWTHPSATEETKKKVVNDFV